VGAENQSFKANMLNFNRERIVLAVGTNGFALVCLDETLAWAQQRAMLCGRRTGQRVTHHMAARQLGPYR
jgi:alkylation response protein AidB-like acyl-CoA dehydrogenase